MCIVVKEEQFKNPFVADRDITVWKTLHPDMTSIHMGHEYKIGATYETYLVRVHKQSNKRLNGHEHGHINGPPLVGIEELEEAGYVFVGPGLHAYADLDVAKRCMPLGCCVLYEAVIPKGAKYLLDEWGGACSEALRVTRKIKEYERDET